MPEIQQHPDYHEGYFDALEGAPLFDDASEAYRAGWTALHETKAILAGAGFKQTSPTQFSKTTVIDRNSNT